MNFVV